MDGDKFECSLKLEGQGKPLEVPCGNIPKIDVSILSYGFHGRIRFVVHKDEELDFFYEPAIIKVTLTVTPLDTTDPENELKPFELKGIITDKTLSKEAIEGYKSDEVQARECVIEFCDPACAIWSQHFPVQIFTEKSMKDVIEEYISDSISIKYDSDLTAETHPLIAIGLGDPRNTVDFYTFLMWHFETQGSIWQYDYTEKQYVISDKKDDSGEVTQLPCDKAGVSVFWPEPSRQNQRVVNSYTEDFASEEVEGEEVFEEIRRDRLFPTPIPDEVTKKATDIKPKNHTCEHQLIVDFKRYPKKDLYPGNLFNFEDPYWGKELYFKEKEYRIHTLQLDLTGTENPMTKTPMEQQEYVGSVVGVFETKEEVLVQRPNIRVPVYPFALEGKVLSELGEKQEETFEIGKDEETDQTYYTVKLPWAEDQTVKAPFEPTYINGQSYYPLLHDQRVVVHFTLFKAKIVEVKNWFEMAELPRTVQGNKTVFAPWKEDEGDLKYTIMEHKEDANGLTFLIERQQEKQVQYIRITHDGLHLMVHEAKKTEPQCHIWMNNEHRIEINSQVKPNEKQTMVLEPKKITTICEDGGDKSSITQTPTKISIECDEFELTTEKETTLVSKGPTSTKGKKVTIKGDSGVAIEDGSKVAISAPSITEG